MQFTVRNKNITFIAELSGKYNVIVGDSGIGKTTLYNFLHGAEDGIVGYDLEIDTPFHVLDKRESFEQIDKYSNTLLILDEECILLHQKDTAARIKEVNNRLLIISRSIPKFLPMGIRNLLTVENVNNVYTLKPVYKECGKRKFVDVEKIITEDSDSGFEFFKKNFSSECISSFGNGNLYNMLCKYHADEGTLAVFDAAGIIPVAKKLYRYLQRHNVQYLDWDSFETYVLTQPPFRMQANYDDISYESIEQASVQKLKEFIVYDKCKLPSCLNYAVGCDNCNSQCAYKLQKFECDLHISTSNNPDTSTVSNIKLF